MRENWMEEAKKCDRCGAYYCPSKQTLILRVYNEDTNSPTEYGGDMCAKCAAKFEKWWTKPKRKARR